MFSPGCLATISFAKAAIASASVTSRVAADMFGRPAIAASSLAALRPVTMTLVARVMPTLRERQPDARTPAGDEDGVACGFHELPPLGW
jgi:Na+-transporting methylmalonyl-CoA/oxaloacetate decarboxylase beta subunit